MKKLRKRLRTAERRVNRLQSLRERVRKIIAFAERRKFETLKNRAVAISERLRKRINEQHATIREIRKKIAAIEERRRKDRDDFVRWALAQVGTVEGSAKQREWAADLGYSWTLPWCSIFAGYGLKHWGGFEGRLPTNPAYSGNWLTWAHGHRVSYDSHTQPGSLIVFDWGDGGISDHVAIFVGNGMKVGGNENNRVEKDAVPTGNIVGVIEPNWND